MAVRAAAARRGWIVREWGDWGKIPPFPAAGAVILTNQGPAGRKRRTRLGSRRRHIFRFSSPFRAGFLGRVRLGLTRSFPCSASHRAGYGGLCPHPPKGMIPFGNLFCCRAFAIRRATPKTKEDLARLDIWRARSSDLKMYCQKRKAGLEPLPQRRKVRSR